MSPLSLIEHPHRRLNPLTGEWVLVSPHRTNRPWSGQVEDTEVEQRPSYSPDCYLCPGNTRANGERNPEYTSTFIFQNDFAAFSPDVPNASYQCGPLLLAEGEAGLCRVICFSPRHDLTLARMTPEQILPVIDCWADQTRELGSRPEISYVQVFENKGEMMGCSNPHPHGQIWATAHLPNEPAKEDIHQRAHYQETGHCLLCEYLETELAQDERVLCGNEHFVALVPFWACWPFETLVLPRRHQPNLPALLPAERQALAALLRQLTAGYDQLFNVSFPYSMGWHQAPTSNSDFPEWHLHAHFYPPLLRSATVKKIMGGFELFGTPQRDITPEVAAKRLREVLLEEKP